MNPDCAIKALGLLASCLAVSRGSNAWGAIADQCAEIWKHARLAIECTASSDPAETLKWFLDFESIGMAASQRPARIAILAQRGMAAVRALEPMAEREPSAKPIVLAASILFQVVATHPESLAMPVREETARILADMSRLFDPNPTAHENPDLL